LSRKSEKRVRTYFIIVQKYSPYHEIVTIPTCWVNVPKLSNFFDVCLEKSWGHGLYNIGSYKNGELRTCSTFEQLNRWFATKNAIHIFSKTFGTKTNWRLNVKHLEGSNHWYQDTTCKWVRLRWRFHKIHPFLKIKLL